MEIDKEYGGIRSFEVHGYFVSRLKAFVATFLFVSFLIAVVVLAALLAHEKSKGDITGVSGNQAGNQGRWNGRSLWWFLNMCLFQGRNKVYEIRDHSPGIWDHNTWDRDQQCFSGIRDQNCERFWDQGSKFPMFLWSGIKILNVFVIRDQNLGQKYRISYEKIYLVATLLNCHDFVSCTDQKHSCSIVAFEIVELVFFFWVWSDR